MLSNSNGDSNKKHRACDYEVGRESIKGINILCMGMLVAGMRHCPRDRLKVIFHESRVINECHHKMFGRYIVKVAGMDQNSVRLEQPGSRGFFISGDW